MNKPKFLSVLLPINIDRPFTYTSDDNLGVGTIVKVSFGKRELYGVVWGANKNEKKPDNIKIKPIIEVAGKGEAYILPTNMLKVLVLSHCRPTLTKATKASAFHKTLPPR